MNKVLICFLVMLMSVAALAQSQQVDSDFKKAKELVHQKKYEDAMAKFLPLTVYQKTNPYVQYALFYYAYCAQQAGYTKVAKENYFQLIQLYPKWNKMEEVYFHLTRLLLQSKDWFPAYQQGKKIQSPELTTLLVQEKRLALKNTQDKEMLELLLEEYPNDVAAKERVEQLNNVKSAVIDSQLKNNFVLLNGDKNQSIRVAVLLPFMLHTLKPSPEEKKNQQILNFYEGIRIGIDSLRAVGLPIEMMAYDTKRDSLTIQQILAKPEVATADMMIGPVFNQGMKLVQSYCAAHGITLYANPFSGDDVDVQKVKSMYLFQPTDQTMATRSAEMLHQLTPKKYCIIYAGEKSKDSLKVIYFTKRANELGMHVAFKRKLNKKNTAFITMDLTDRKDSVEFKIKRDSLAGVYVASDNALVYLKAFNAVESRHDNTWLIGEEMWFYDNPELFAKFSENKVVFATPNLRYYATPQFIAFQQKFIRAKGFVPDWATLVGMNAVYSLSLREVNRKYTRADESQLTFPGILDRGYKPDASKGNSIVPFVLFRNGTVIEVERN